MQFEIFHLNNFLKWWRGPRTTRLIHLLSKAGKSGVIARVFEVYPHLLYLLSVDSQCSFSSIVRFLVGFLLKITLVCSFRCPFARNQAYYRFWAWYRTYGPIEERKQIDHHGTVSNNSPSEWTSFGLTFRGSGESFDSMAANWHFYFIDRHLGKP